MSKWSSEPDPGKAEDAAAGGLRDATVGNFNSVLVVGRSHVTCVVVAKIVEKSGLRPVSEAPEAAGRLLAELRPATVILDGGAANNDCDHLFDPILAQRRASPQKTPRVILLSNRNGTPEGLTLGHAIDAIVAKPITPETLQPVVERLLADLRS